MVGTLGAIGKPGQHLNVGYVERGWQQVTRVAQELIQTDLSTNTVTLQMTLQC